jgi:uncharacterized protein involved in exopolysaccharide biosynthesis
VDRYSGYRDRGEMDLVGFVLMLWRHRGLVTIACVLSLLLGIGYLMIATPMYHAEVVLIAAEEDSMSGKGTGGSVGDKLGGLASLAGLNMGQESSSEMTADAVLDSRTLVEEYIRRNDLVPVLLKKMKRPTLWRAVRLFKDTLSKVKRDQMKNTTKVSVEWSDPATAARWANGLVALANEMMRAHARAEASRNIEYLNKQLEGTTDVQLRQNLYDILETQMQTLMLADGRSEYAFRVIDPGVPPEVRSRPQLILVLLISLALGLAVGCTIAFVRERLAERRREDAAREEAADALNWRDRRLSADGTSVPTQVPGKV